jgi:large subunit ribosomal protein L15
MKLNELKPAVGAVKRKKRVGRGIGSGHGKTSGRGHKGRGSRSGGNTPAGYEGGQMPLQRRLPKRGFRRSQKATALRKEFGEVNLKGLIAFSAGEAVDPALMADRGLVREGLKVKILGDGEIKHALTVRAHAFSKSAREKIVAAGGVAEVILPENLRPDEATQQTNA